MTHRLPPTPRKRTFGLPVRRQAPTNTMERLRTMERRHQEEERPFDPERQGERWQGSSRDLVVNASQFHQDLLAMVEEYHGHLRTDLSADEIVEQIQQAIKEKSPGAAMRVADKLLEGHGVEAIGPVNASNGPPYTYINFGDPYVSTLMWSRDENKFFVGSWGDVVPEMETNLLEEEWGSWLQSDFTKKVLSQLEDDEFDDLERAEEILDSWDSEAFSKLVWDTQQNTKSSSGKYPEITTESEGIYVHNLDTVVDRAVELFKEKRYSPNNGDEGDRVRRFGKQTVRFDHVETRGVLAGAYRRGRLRGRALNDDRTMLTHLVFVQRDGNEVRAGCQQPLENIVDTYGASEAARRGEEAPTCPTCLRVWMSLDRR